MMQIAAAWGVRPESRRRKGIVYSAASGRTKTAVNPRMSFYASRNGTVRMLESSPDGAAAFCANWLTNVLQFPAAIRNSLNPATEHDARKVQAQLAFVRANLRP